MSRGGDGLGSWFPWSDEMRAARAEEEAMYRYDDGLTLRDRIEDNEWVARARFGWELATLAPRMAFTSLAALLVLFAGIGLVLVGLVYVALAVWVARQTGDATGRLLRHPWRLGTWLAAPVGLVVAVAVGATNAVLAILIIGCLSAARWMAPRVVERPVEPEFPITYADGADTDRWNAFSLDWVRRDWPRVAEASGLVYWRDLPQRMTQRQAYLHVTDPGWRQQQKIDELVNGKQDATEAVVPELLSIHVTPLGPELTVMLHDGQTPTAYEGAADAMAVAYDVPGVRVRRLEGRYVALQLVASDPLAAGIPELTAAVRPTESLSYVEMGVLESGERWMQPLLESSWVVGGVPGAGKSVALNVLLARLAGRPDVQLILVDCKEGLEMGPWEARATAVAGSPEEALPIIEELVGHMRARLQWMRRVGTRRMADYGHSAEHPMYVLVIDEVAELWGSGTDKATAQALVGAVSKLVRLGRAASFVTVAATQKPTTDALPSAIRDNAPSKLAARCTTPQQVTAIFGEGVPKGQPSPVDITERQRGYMVVSQTAGLYERGRTPYIGDEAIAELVAATAHLRHDLTDEDLSDRLPVGEADAGGADAPEPEAPSEPTVADLHEAGEVGRRTANRLGTRTLAEIASMNRAELLALPGIGDGSVGELEMALHARGLALREDEEADRDDA